METAAQMITRIRLRLHVCLPVSKFERKTDKKQSDKSHVTHNEHSFKDPQVHHLGDTLF